MLASCGLFDDGPPNYSLPTDVISPLQLRTMFGLQGGAGGAGSDVTTTASFALDDGRWAHAELLYVDQALSNWVTPPSDADLRGATMEWPIRDTGRTFTFAERPPDILDEVFGCVRLVVSTRDFAPRDEAARQQFLEDAEEWLSLWLSELPQDPCEGRPSSPPDHATPPPAGIVRSG